MDVNTRESGDANAIATAQQFGWTDWLFAVVLVIAVFVVYLPCWHGGFLWDDDSHLLNNPVLKPGGLAKVWVPGGYINYWPITYTAYWLQFHLWGLQPLGYHLVNVALHALSALFVWRLLVRLQVPGAMLAAAVFALHPVNVESVAWISQLKGLLSAALALTSMLIYLSYERDEGRWRYGLSIFAFLLSALAKGTALTLPIILLACAWWQRGRIGRRDLLRVLP
jgi:protein O-mannosyl-transferase